MDDLSEQHQKYLSAIAAKGWEVAQRLVAVKAGQDVCLADLGGTDDERRALRETRLRGYLDMIERSRSRLLAQNGSYGRCVQCSAPFSNNVLGEMPWIERCQTCESEHSAHG